MSAAPQLIPTATGVFIPPGPFGLAKDALRNDAIASVFSLLRCPHIPFNAPPATNRGWNYDGGHVQGSHGTRHQPIWFDLVAWVCG